MIPSKQMLPSVRPDWVLLPLRLFLGITFVYAGVQKLTDPQFFNPHAAGYIGKQIIGFSNGSPIHFLLIHFIEHAVFFGLLVAFGEIAIGLGALFGVLFRPAAFFGMLLSLLFFLSASWHVYPYFYGADIVFVFGWLTLLLNGPLNTGLPSVDALLTVALLQRASPQQQALRVPMLGLVLGTVRTAPPLTNPEVSNASIAAARPRGTQQTRLTAAQRAQENRRNFLFGTLAGGIGALGLAAFGYALNVFLHPTSDTTTVIPSQAPTPIGTASAGGTSTSGAIAQVSAVPTNSAVQFTLPSNGDPGVLVHLNSGQFVAYDATCTHAGCQVDYDPSSQLLTCPCHGAAFDPAKQGEVVNPPANTPLQSVSIKVDSATGAITLQ